MMRKGQGNLEAREVGLVEPPLRVLGQLGHGEQADLSLSEGRAGRAEVWVPWERSVLSRMVAAGVCLVMTLVTH